MFPRRDAGRPDRHEEAESLREMGLFPRGQIARTPSHRRREAIATVLRGSSTIVFLALLLLLPGPSVSAGVPPIVRGHASPMGGSDWTNMNPGTAPSASVNMAMVYDFIADLMFVFGGYEWITQGIVCVWGSDVVKHMRKYHCSQW